MRMETEQMAAIADHRQGGATCRNCGAPYHGGTPCKRPAGGRAQGVEMTHSAKVETPAPIPARTMQALVASVPDDAEFTVTPIVGGSQRDPYTTGYRIIANWSTT